MLKNKIRFMSLTVMLLGIVQLLLTFNATREIITSDLRIVIVFTGLMLAISLREAVEIIESKIKEVSGQTHDDGQDKFDI